MRRGWGDRGQERQDVVGALVHELGVACAGTVAEALASNDGAEELVLPAHILIAMVVSTRPALLVSVALNTTYLCRVVCGTSTCSTLDDTAEGQRGTIDGGESDHD